MKRFLFGFLAVLFLILNTIPYLHILADDMPTSSQYEMLGAYALSTLITSGEATELDFSDYTENDTSFLIDLGEAIFTGDWSGLAEDGLEWLGETADSIYDSYKEYVSQWKYDHLGIMYSNWFPDEQIRVGPDDSYSLAKPLRELLTPRDNNTPTPQPNPNYSTILNQYSNWTGFRFSNMNGAVTPVNVNGISYYNTDAFSVICSNSNLTGNAFTFPNNAVSGGFQVFEPLDFLINSSTFSIFVRVRSSLLDITNQWTTYSGISCSQSGYNYSFNRLYIYNSNQSQDLFRPWGSRVNNGLYATQPSPESLDSAVYWICNHTANCNIYYGSSWSDCVQWVNFDGPSYPIVIPGQLTIWNDQPLEYSFPEDTYLKLPDLTTIITNAINNSGVVMWSDIADVFVDVNGQTAIAVTKIVRNDYDNLYMEQYPYPAMLVGMTEQTKFNEHLLDDSHAYLSPMGTVVQETVNVLPPELVGVLAIGAILTIFAVIINRLLE